MAAIEQFQFFGGSQKLTNSSRKLFKFYNHIPHDMEMCMWLFQGFTEIHGRHAWTSFFHIFLWAQKLKNWNQK